MPGAWTGRGADALLAPSRRDAMRTGTPRWVVGVYCALVEC